MGLRSHTYMIILTITKEGILMTSKTHPNVKVICQDCGIEFETTYDSYRTAKNNPNKVWRCKNCRHIHRSNLMKIKDQKKEQL